MKKTKLLIAGPCQIESKEHCFKIAEFLQKSTESTRFQLVFKASFDKANRTSLSGVRGVGLTRGLEILKQVRDEFGVPITTDIHTSEQASIAGECVDILQIPAFLCRQTDILVSAAKTGKIINVKKGQFLAPSDMKYAIQKVVESGNSLVMQCERGSCFGMRDLVVDMRSLITMWHHGYPVILDATHSVQSMGGAGGSSGGAREFILPLIRSGIATGALSGLFIECHDNPKTAPSDGSSMLTLEEVSFVLEQSEKLFTLMDDNSFQIMTSSTESGKTPVLKKDSRVIKTILEALSE